MSTMISVHSKASVLIYLANMEEGKKKEVGAAAKTQDINGKKRAGWRLSS